MRMLELEPRESAASPDPPAPAPHAGLPWALAALMVGTVIAVDPRGLVPTGPLRWTVIAVATGVTIAALTRTPFSFPPAMTALWIGLLAVLFVATVHAVDPLHAWIGTPDRRLGFLAWMTFPALFVAGYACSARAAARIVFRAATIGALVLGVWSTAELLGHPPLGLEFANARAGGPNGSPAYLGAACLLLGPLAVGVILDSGETRAWRRIAAGASAGALLALAGSQTRAAWLGAVVAAIAIGLRQRAAFRSHRRGVLVALVACVAIALAVAVSTPLGSRATSTFNLDHGTSASRFDEWRIASRAIADHPGLGTGPEGYRVVFPQGVDAAYVRSYGVAVYPDRAHNGILDVTLDGGVLAGLLYAALLAFAVRHAWRALRTRDPVDLALGGAVLAYVVQQQLLFPLSELDPIFWVLVGMLVARDPLTRRARAVHARWLVVPIVFATAVALNYGAREVLADRALERAAKSNDPRAALQDADRATRLRSDSIRAWYVAARVAQRGDALTDVDAALDRVTQGLHRSPRDPALRVLYGELLTERAARSRLADDIATARRELARLVAGAPHDPRLRNAQVTALSLTEIGKP